MKEKNITSRIFLVFVLMNFLRRTPSREYTLTKKAPKRPAIAPITMAANPSVMGEDVISIVPNFNEPAAVNDSTPPFIIYCQNPRMNVLIAAVKKTLQSILKLQKVFGLEISYVNRAPPIGAPKAAATPAELPAAINVRLS